MTAEKNARIAATRRTTIERHSAMRACGYSEQRDVHAARNMILLAATGDWEKKTPAGRRVAPLERSSSGSGYAASKNTSLKEETTSLKKVTQDSGYAAETASSLVTP